MAIEKGLSEELKSLLENLSEILNGGFELFREKFEHLNPGIACGPGDPAHRRVRFAWSFLAIIFPERVAEVQRFEKESRGRNVGDFHSSSPNPFRSGYTGDKPFVSVADKEKREIESGKKIGKRAAEK